MYTREDATEGSTLLEKYEAAKKITLVGCSSNPLLSTIYMKMFLKKSIRSGADQYF